MHHLVFGIYFQIHSISLTSLCLSLPPHPLLNPFLSSSLLSSSITLSLQAQNLPFQQILPTLDFFYLLDCLMIMGLDQTYRAHHFIFRYFLFIPCDKLSWLPVSFLLNVKYTLSYHIVSYLTYRQRAEARST